MSKAKASKNYSSISVTINGRQFYAEGDAAEVSKKLDEFMSGIFSPFNRAVRSFTEGRKDWRTVLGIRSEKVTLEQVEHRFRILAKKHHPDKGGDRAKFEEITAARDAARLELAS